MITGSVAPSTQITWNRDSKRAKDRPRVAVRGIALDHRVECLLARRRSERHTERQHRLAGQACETACRPGLPGTPPPHPATGTPPRCDAAPSARSRRPPTRRCGERHDHAEVPHGRRGQRRDIARIATGAPGTAMAWPAIAPSSASVASPRSVKANRKVTDPTTQRSVPIVEAAESTPALRSSARLGLVLGLGGDGGDRHPQRRDRRGG